jgi:hypothetical protein
MKKNKIKTTRHPERNPNEMRMKSKGVPEDKLLGTVFDFTHYAQTDGEDVIK